MMISAKKMKRITEKVKYWIARINGVNRIRVMILRVSFFRMSSAIGGELV
jgi:hypothetical protein